MKLPVAQLVERGKPLFQTLDRRTFLKGGVIIQFEVSVKIEWCPGVRLFVVVVCCRYSGLHTRRLEGVVGPAEESYPH